MMSKKKNFHSTGKGKKMLSYGCSQGFGAFRNKPKTKRQPFTGCFVTVPAQKEGPRDL